MVPRQKRSEAEGLLPTCDKQVEQGQCGWSWWDGEISSVPGNVVLSSPISQHQALLPAPVSCSGHSPTLASDLVYLSTFCTSLGLLQNHLSSIMCSTNHLSWQLKPLNQQQKPALNQQGKCLVKYKGYLLLRSPSLSSLQHYPSAPL